MNVADARGALRWALFNPNAAEAAGAKMLESVPQIMTTVGAYMLSEWIAKRFGGPTQAAPASGMVALLRTPQEAMAYLATGSRGLAEAPSVSVQQVEGSGGSL